MHTFRRSAALVFAALVSIAGCSGEDGKDGVAGQDGTDAPAVAGPGFQLTIQSATIPATGQPTVTFEALDAAGRPVDVKAETAAGAFGSRGMRFTIAQRQADGTLRSLYESGGAGTYAPRAATSFTLAQLADMMTMVSPGVYRFSVPATQIAPAFTPTRTAVFTIAAFASRSFEGVGYPGADTYDFTPSTGAVAAAREVVADAACNACHGNMQAHGSRRGVTTCLTCHYPGFVDADSGEGIDFRSMVHKIHTGAYVFNADTDFSTIEFPPGNSLTNCVGCHQGADAANFRTKPSRAACGSCHAADIVGAGTDLDATDHLSGFTDDTGCTSCHGDTTGSRPISVVHGPTWNATTNLASYVPKALDVTITAIDFTDPAAPTVSLMVTVDGAGYDAKTTPLASFSIYVSADTADYASEQGSAGDGILFSTSFSGTGAANLVAGAAAGQFTAPLASLATLATGTSVGVGFEAYIASTGRNYNAAYKPVQYAVVGTGTVEPRRTITSNAKCNACHKELGFHSNSSRKGPEYCAFCHTPNNVNDQRVSRYEVFPSTTDPYETTPESVSIMQMAHKLHAGGPTDGALSNVYTLGTDRSLSAGAPVGDATTFINPFVGDLGNCQTCHDGETYGLPDAANLGTRSALFGCVEDPAADSTANFCGPDLETDAGCTEDPAADTDDFCEAYVVGDYWQSLAETVTPPQAAACTSCHDSDAAKGHAMLNTVGVYPAQIETCAVCHGEGATYDALEVHQPAP